jgi:cytochrome c-type biogenesis protein CcsB
MKVWLALIAACCLVPPVNGAERLDFKDASRIVIQSSGRKKPLDTFASEALQSISGRRTYTDRVTGQKYSSTDLLFTIWFGEGNWKERPLILVSNAALRDRLGLGSRERLYSFDTLLSNAALTEIYHTIQTKRARKEELSPIEKEAETVISRIEQLGFLASPESMTIVPEPNELRGTWIDPTRARELYGAEAGERLAALIRRTAEAHRARDGQAFAAASQELRQSLVALKPEHYLTNSEVEREVHYNTLHPFRWAWICCLAAFFLLLAPRTRLAGEALFLACIGLQTYGFVLRCLIAGHVPVTNMYESLVWVAFGLTVIAYIFYRVFKAPIALLTAAPLAVLGLMLADMLPSVLSPNIGPLPPVLRDNFWLATHVMTITLGYSAFALATGLAHYILGYELWKRQSLNENSTFHDLLYRTLQIGVLLLAAGTILGGVWAYYSWGRFWGWDPKETWALIALLLYIFALHGRIAGWWGSFGMSVAAALCFHGILMTWYGVNFVLGKGLHSYGFGGGGFFWIGSAVALDFAFVGYCILAHSRKVRSTTPVATRITKPREPALSERQLEPNQR